MATVDDTCTNLTDVPVSPNTKEKLAVLLKSVTSGEAQLEKDAEGKIQIKYSNKTERKIPLSHVDRSQAHTVQVGKNDKDVNTRLDVCLEMLEEIKKNCAPSGVVLDKTKVGVSMRGDYKEGKQFEKLSEVLGKGNIAGDIIVIKDKKTGTEHAVKTVMISAFSSNEVRAWVDLGESESFPSLYVFRLEGNEIIFNMEKIEHGVTLDGIIDDHMNNLRQKAPELARPFSLCIFHGLLSAYQEMHDKNWTHGDLHGSNVMITKGTMTLKVLDFGNAKPFAEGSTFNFRGLKKDILNIIRLFSGLYIGQDFIDNYKLEKLLKEEKKGDGSLRKALLEEETASLTETDRKELLQLIMMTYQVTQNPEQPDYGSATPVVKHIEKSLLPEETMEVMRKAAAILFPDFCPGDINVQETPTSPSTVEDGARSQTAEVGVEELNLDKAAAAIPEEFLQSLRISIE